MGKHSARDGQDGPGNGAAYTGGVPRAGHGTPPAGGGPRGAGFPPQDGDFPPLGGLPHSGEGLQDGTAFPPAGGGPAGGVIGGTVGGAGGGPAGGTVGGRVPQAGSGTFAPPGTALGTPGSGRRRRTPVGPYTEPFDPFVDSGAFAAVRPRHPENRPPNHPEHREHGAWGAPDTWADDTVRRRDLPFDPVEEWAEGWAAQDAATAAELRGPRVHPPGRTVPRPRQEFLDAFEPPAPAAGPAAGGEEPPAPPAEAAAQSAPRRRPGRVWTVTGITGIAAAAVVTVAAVTTGSPLGGLGRKHPGPDPAGPDTTSTTPAPSHTAAPGAARAPKASAAPAAPLPSYDQQMDLQYPLAADLQLSGAFDTVPGHQAAPGKGRVMTFRVDVERGLPLDAQLFSDTVFRTLNDDRSWGHGGTMTFERVGSGDADIVVTLASPGTTAKWCAKSGLDTTIDNVSCDAASTPRTMINAYRWAQGADTFGPELMHAYRQMLINHEVGHRLGHHHVGCPTAGAPAPVMMQQTKFLSLNGGPACRPNAWPYP
ncbi:DUF3152 domain-containing protein [Streptomyces sp. NPDC020983]|uniref:DUF3152 domain-containing protein n=1 Tax=Streptomyces sp. NPDC020983 TaxID=3365106 RepID=UPI0037981A11